MNLHDEIISRGRVRYRGIWRPFRIGAPETVRGLIIKYFSLYAQAYEQGVSVLMRVAGQDLARIIAMFDLAMEKIEADEAKALMDEAARRYLHQLDMRIESAKYDSAWKEYEGEFSLMDVRIAALEADYESLETKKAELNFLKRELTTQYTGLQRSVQEEELNRRMADLDMVRADIDLQQTEVDLLRKGLQIEEAGIEEQVQQTAVQTKEAQLLTREAERERVSAETGHIDTQILGERLTQEGVRLEQRGVEDDMEEFPLRLQQEILSRSEMDNQVARGDGHLEEALMDQRRSRMQVREGELNVARIGLEKETAERLTGTKLDQQVDEISLRIDGVRHQQSETVQSIRKVGQDVDRTNQAIRGLGIQKDAKALQVSGTNLDRERIESIDKTRTTIQKTRLETSAEEEGLRKNTIEFQIDKIEGVDSLEVELQIREQQMNIIEAQARLVDIQSEIIRLSTAMAKVDVAVKEEESRAAQIEVDTVKLGFTEQRAEGEEAIHGAEKDAIPMRESYSIEEYNTRKTIAEQERQSLVGHDATTRTLYELRRQTESRKSELDRSRYDLSLDEAELNKARSEYRQTQSNRIADREYTVGIVDHKGRLDVISAEVSAVSDLRMAIERMLRDLEQMEINTTVAHLIGRTS